MFDTVRVHVSAELWKEPRGGGRDRNRIVRHTLISELDMAKKAGVRTPADVMRTDEGVQAHRNAYCDEFGHCTPRASQPVRGRCAT